MSSLTRRLRLWYVTDLHGHPGIPLRDLLLREIKPLCSNLLEVVVPTYVVETTDRRGTHFEEREFAPGCLFMKIAGPTTMVEKCLSSHPVLSRLLPIHPLPTHMSSDPSRLVACLQSSRCYATTDKLHSGDIVDILGGCWDGQRAEVLHDYREMAEVVFRKKGRIVQVVLPKKHLLHIGSSPHKVRE